MSKPIKMHSFCGKRYSIKHVSKKSLQTKQEKEHGMICRGLCNSPNKKKKAIKIDKTLYGKEQLEVYIHEAIHASDFELSEKLVRKMGRDIASFLWRLGYRLKEDF